MSRVKSPWPFTFTKKKNKAEFRFEVKFFLQSLANFSVIFIYRYFFVRYYDFNTLPKSETFRIKNLSKNPLIFGGNIGIMQQMQFLIMTCK